MNKRMFMCLSMLCLFCVIDSRRRENSLSNGSIRENASINPAVAADDVIEKSLVERVEEAKIDTELFEQKKKEVIAFVNDGIEYLKNNPLYNAFHAFTRDKEFRRGELYLVVYDTKGNCLADGQLPQMLWKNNYNLRDEYGTPMVQEMLAIAKKGGGWVTYQWRGATKVAYCKIGTKDDQDYLFFAGYYPHSKQAAVINLVKGAVALFNKVKEEGRPIEEAFSTFSYPLGRFVLGDLYLFAISFDGITVAHGERPGLIGTSALDYKSGGRYINREIIEKLQKTDEGVWVEYISKRAPKKLYSEKVTDNKGKQYFISCGYYPDAGQQQVVELVREGYTYMKKNGLTEAVSVFSDLTNNQFRYGDLYLVIYDFKGICKAHGTDRDMIGRDMINDQDEDGRYYVREIVEKAEQLEKRDVYAGGWLSFKLKNSFKLIYIEPIDLGVDKFIITSGLYPVSKMETMILLAKSAASYLRSHSAPEAFRAFVQPAGKLTPTNVQMPGGQFINGDLSIFVFDSTGICLAFGDDYNYIWRNLLNAKDDDGKPYVKILINTGMRGSGKVSFRLNGMPVEAYVEKVEKEGRTLIVGSHYFK